MTNIENMYKLTKSEAVRDENGITHNFGEVACEVWRIEKNVSIAVPGKRIVMTDDDFKHMLRICRKFYKRKNEWD